MSIQWNREVKMKDIAKFFNQEIKLGEVNYNKCLQVSTLIVAFGVIPSFTYGTVLGTLDAQREALISEVQQLQAQVVSSVPKVNQVIANVATDKETYTTGSPVQLTFYSLVPASTTNIYQISLYSTSGALVQNLATLSPYQGPNKFSFSVATSTLEKNTGPYVVRVTATKYNQSVDSNKFVVQKYAIDDRPMSIWFISLNAYKSFTADADGEKDVGTYEIRYRISAIGNDVYLRKNGVAWATTSDSTTGKTLFSTLSSRDSSPLDTKDSYFIRKGFAREFTLKVDLEATKDGYAGIAIKSMEWGHTSPSPYPDKTFVVDAHNTNMLSLYSFGATATADVSNTQAGVSVFRTADISLSFVLNNSGKQDIYISKDGFKSIGYEASQKVASSTFNGGIVAGDTQSAYIIKAGTKRFLALNVSMVNKGPEKLQSFAVKKIYFSDQLGLLNKYNISSGLENLKITQSF